MRIIRYPALTEPQFFGCTAAFVDSFFGELNAAAGALRRLQGGRKGSAFLHEMELDSHRYGAMIVLDRWSRVVSAYLPHLTFSRETGIARETQSRASAAEFILTRANELIDRADDYSTEMVEACILAWQSLQMTFREEREETDRSAKLGPMLPEEYTSARRIFLEDLAQR